ncbi:beta strand repeat-containing protein [Proteus mirabilis]|uniref:beta strand repeat-containing protein n=1 Tax=Proteus mirabilis TaxID=584 RepID=UPI0039B612C6
MNIIFFEKNSNEKVQLQPHAKHTITAKAGDVYQLIDSDTQLSPLDIQAHRKSDDLILSSKEQNIEVVIKDFWLECQPGEQQCYATLNVLDSNGVMGQATITQDGPVLEHLVAGETGTLSDNDDGIGLFLWGAGSIGSALAIFLANRNHGGGNKGNEADITAPSKPGLTAEDDGSVSIDLPKDANKGDSVDVTFEDEDGNSNTVTLEKGDNGWTSSDPELIPDTDNNQVTIPNDKIKDNSDVTASAKDPSGNKSDDVTVTAKPDPVSDIPVLSIPEVDDGYANADELKDGLQAEVTLPAGTVEGAEITLTVTRPDNTTETITYTVTKDDVAAGKISIDIPKDAVQNGQNSVDVSLTQGNNPAKPGNKVDFAVDGQIPGDTDGDGVVDTTPVVTIPEAADGVNADELKDGVQTEVTVPGGSAAGDTLTLTITKPDGSTDTVEHTLTADEVAAGKADVTIPADKVTADGNYSVTAEITDPAGNTSGQGQPTDFIVDTQIPGDTDGDGVVDTTPVVTIPEAADGVNADELKDGVQTEVTVPGGSAAGDTLTLTITKPDGSTDTVEHTLTADEVVAGKADVTIPADKVTADGNYSVTAEITDPAGNTSGQGQPTDFIVDTQIPGDTDGDGVVDTTPVVTIPEATDGVNADELKDGVQTEVTVPGGSAEGDKLTLTITKPDGSTDTVEHILTADEVAAGKADVTIPADKVTADGNYSVTAEITDPAGNTSGQGQPTDFAVDTVAPSAPVLKAEDDGSVTVDLPTDANKGDTVEITFEDEKGDKHTVTLEKGDNGWTSDTPALIPDSNGDKATIPADNVKDNSEVTGIAKDPSGNESDPSTVTSKTDGVTDAPVLSIPEVVDGYANADELKDGLQAEVTLPAGTAEGAEITLTVTRPDKTTETVTHTVTKDEATAGKVSVDIPKDAVQNGQNSVDVSLTQGNNPAKPGNKVDFAVDGQIPGDTDGDGTVDTTPVVTIPEATDGVNADELKDGVQTEVTVPGGSAAGDTLTLTITKPDGSTDTVEHTLTADEVAAGKADVTIPADKVTADGNYSVTAEVTDPAGNTSGQGQPTDFVVDTVAPSAPVLKAEDDGSVTVDLPTDANKGDTVEITFEDEKGDKQTVTMEKGDNGWTSSDPNLIPDSQGNNTAIPSDNVKDNSEVTAIAKDPSGNESAPATATSKTDVLPTVSISVDTTSVNDNGDKISADASVSGEVTEVPATIEDKDDTTGLVYTVALDYVAAQDVTVTITLTNDTGHASAPDYSTLAGSQHDGKIALHGDTGKVTYDGASTVTVVIPAGSKSVSFIVDPTMEANQNAFNAEGMEKVVATITGTSNNATAVTDTVNNAGASATGVIYDGNSISLRNLDGDFTLKYSLSSSVAENGDFGYTIGVDSGKKDPKLTTDYNDTIYVGFYQDGSETSSYSNLANSQDNGPDGTKTDGNQSITTVDLGAGDDLMVIRGNMLTNTRVYAGEGNDTFTMDGMNTALRSMYSGSYLFMESGNDTVTIKRTGVTNAGQIYLGSGSDTFTQGDANDQNNTELSGLLDLGSGTQDKSNMPNEYLSVYQDGSNLSLGNDNNIDAVTDVNTVTIYGSVSGEILGGYGSDNITITKNLTGNVSVGDNTDTLTAGWIYGGATVSMGDGNDTVTVTEGAYNTTISLGAGDDVFDATSGVMGDSVSATLVNGEDGNDTIKLGTIGKNLTVDAGAGDDTVILTKDYDPSPIGNQGYINGGEGTDTLVLSGTITVNMATKTDEGIANFEKVDMTVNSELKVDNSSQTIKLTASDVLGMNANSTIYISGDANDKVDLGADGAGSLGTFTATATTTKATALDGTEHTYTLYSSASGANVYIDNNIIDNGGVI